MATTGTADTATTAAPGGRGLSARQVQTRAVIQAIGMLPVLILICVAFELATGKFLNARNMAIVLQQASVNIVLAVGMTFVILTGGIDLSVGSMVAAAAIAGGQFVESGSFLFFLAALGMGVLLGGINAGAVAYGRVPPFMATLAMLLAARGIALWMSDKTPISIFNLEGVRWFGTGEILGIPSAVLVFLALTGLAWVLLNRTRYGRYVIAVGGNREAARIAGINTERIIFSVYVLAGICVAVAAILVSGRLSSASPIVGNLYELDAIAAVVIGGTALAGGRATIVGTFLGVITFALIFNLLTLMDLAVEIQQVTKGLIILAAVLIQRRDR